MAKFTTILIAILMSFGFMLEATSLASKPTGKAFPWNDGAPSAHGRYELN